MIEKQMLKLMLSKKFYAQYKGQISRSVFQGSFGSLFDTIQKAHEKYDADISVDELYSLHTAVYNPALTKAAKEQLSELIEDIKETTEPSEAIAKDIVNIMAERDVAQKIAIEATEVFNGKPADFNLITKIIDEYKTGLPTEKLDAVTDNVEELIKQLAVTSKWQFNLMRLKENIGGVGPGNLVIIFARPEAGKTAFWVNLVAGIGGFASQGAKVCALINEEPAIRTQMRLINAHTGLTRDEIRADIPEANKLWAEVRQNICILDTVDWSLDDVDEFVQKEKPDILVIDQLDKVGVTGTFARTDEKLRAIYTGAREIAKRNECCVIALSQASADGHGKHFLSFDMMEGSKTGKAAEADVIIGVGQNNLFNPNRESSNEMQRHLAISKNKITGWHGQLECVIVPELSRYEL